MFLIKSRRELLLHKTKIYSVFLTQLSNSVAKDIFKIETLNTQILLKAVKQSE